MALKLSDMTPTIIEDVSGVEFFEAQLTARLAEIAEKGIQIGADFLPFIR